MDIATILLTAGTALGGSGSIFLWLETKTESGRKRRGAEIDHHLSQALTPIQSDLQSIHAKLDADSLHSATIIKAAIGEALEPVKDQISTLNTKIEPLWKSLEAMAIAQVQVLHQPDPARAEIDHLLEALHAELEGGPLMPADDYLRLRHFLVLIKSWEPGQDLGFPVSAGEPTSAGILLSIMGLTRERRRQEHHKK